MNNIEELAANVRAYQQTNIPELWKKTRWNLLGLGVNELANLILITAINRDI